MKITTFTNIYPNPEQPDRGIFISQMLNELGNKVKNIIVSPLPWFPAISIIKKEWSTFANIPYLIENNGESVLYPKYPLIPKISGGLHAFLIALRCYSLIKKLVRLNKIDILHGHWIYPDCVALVWIAKRLSLPVLISARGCDINHYKIFFWRRIQIKWALKHADAITTVSDALKDTIIKEFGNVGKKVFVIKNGVNTKLFSRIDKTKARTILRLEKNQKYLLYVGSLDTVKGLNFLIDALGKLKTKNNLNFSTILVGKGPLKNELEQQICNNNLTEEVKLIGAKPHKEISMWMSACDVFCLPSIREGIPNVLLEAKTCGLQIVATNVGGIPEVVDEGVLVPPESSDALADSLADSFNKPTKNIQSFLPHSWIDCADKYIDLYKVILTNQVQSSMVPGSRLEVYKT